MSDDAQNGGGWHLDKRVPIALIVTIIMQTGGALWWAASQSERVNYIERSVIASEPIKGQIIRLETKMDSLNENIVELKSAVQRSVRSSPQ